MSIKSTDIQLSIFSPNQSNPEQLEAIFVQREGLLNRCIENIEASAYTDGKHHQLMVGPRGAGKTHLVTLLVHRIEKNKKLLKHLKIAWLNEDETCVTFLDLLLSIFSALQRRYPLEYTEQDIADIYQQSPEQAQDFLASYLSDALRKNNDTLLIIVENLDALFESIGDKGQKQLRAYLQENPLFTLFATSQRLTDDLTHRHDPFFGFFQTEHLKALSEEEAASLVSKIAALSNKLDVARFLKTPTGKARIKALHHLSGGNHRMYMILSQFISRDSIDTLVPPFLKMVDELTPYYQERLRWLPPLQRKIVEHLATSKTTVSVKSIASRLFSTNQTISSQLKELKNKGYVKSHKRSRESLYELTEPLMRICVEVKENKNHQPIAMLVDFIRIWYDRDTIREKLNFIDEGMQEKDYLFSAKNSMKAINSGGGDANEKGKAYLDIAEIYCYQNLWEDFIKAFGLGLGLLEASSKTDGDYAALRIMVDYLYVNFSRGDIDHNKTSGLFDVLSKDKKALSAFGVDLLRHLGWQAKENKKKHNPILTQWVSAWKLAANGNSDFAITIRLLEVGLDYLQSHDESVFLELVESERVILKNAFGLE